MSNFQQTYPLSSRKFAKKILEKVFFWIIVLVVVEGFFSLFWFSGDPVSRQLIGLVSVGFFVVTVGSFLLYAWYVKVYIRLYYYDASDQFITIKKGVFAPTEIHIQYQKVQDVYVDQDILDRIMGLYDVHIASATASSGIEAHIDGVNFEAAEGLKKLFLDRIVSGGKVGSDGQSMGTPSSLGNQGTVLRFEVPTDVSSTTYPVTGRWLFIRILGSIISSAFFAGALMVYVFVPSKNSDTSLGQSLGLSGHSVTIFFWLFLALLIVHVLNAVLWRMLFSYKFLPDYIMTRSGIISRTEKHLPYHSIQDVTVKQGVIGRIIGIADVIIENAAASGVPVKVGAFGIKGLNPNATVLPGLARAQAQQISEIVRSILQGRTTRGTGV